MQPAANPAPKATGASFGKDSTNLDLLRTFAVLFVVFRHLLYENPSLEKALGMPQFGKFGVLLFFVHTSLVLMLSLQRQGFDTYATPIKHYAAFVTRRVFRIYPLSILVVLLAAFWFLPYGIYPMHYADADSTISVTPQVIAGNLLLIQNVWPKPEVSVLGPLWSLPIEIQMYLVLPFLFVAARKWGLAAIGVIYVVSLGIAATQSGAAYTHSMFKFAPCFIPGVMAFALTVKRRSLPWWVLPIFLLITVVLHSAISSRFGREVLVGFPICLALGVLLPHLQDLPHGTAAKVFQTIAKYSYGIYLFHDVARTFAFQYLHDIPFPVRFAIFMVATIAPSVAAFHWLEQPFIKWGNDFANRIVPRLKRSAAA